MNCLVYEEKKTDPKSDNDPAMNTPQEPGSPWKYLRATALWISMLANARKEI
jgi:hypothetical protein